MLAQATIDAVCQLLAERTHSHRAISRRLGVSRGIVAALASGRRQPFGRTVDAARELEEPLMPAVRCDACGYRVHPPCRICATRAYHAAREERSGRRAGIPPRRVAGSADWCVWRGGGRRPWEESMRSATPADL